MTRLLQDHRLLGSGRDLRHELTGLGVANEDREGRDLAEEDPTITPIGEEADTGVGDRDACESRRVDHSNDGRPHRGPRGLRRAEPLLCVRADHVDDHEGLARAEAEPALQWCTAIRHGQRTDAVSCIAASFFAMCPPLVMASYFGGSSAARHVGSTSMMAS